MHRVVESAVQVESSRQEADQLRRWHGAVKKRCRSPKEIQLTACWLDARIARYELTLLDAAPVQATKSEQT